MTARLLLALFGPMLIAQPSSASTATVQVDRDVTITAVSDEPRFASGVFATAIRITAAAPAGTVDYLLFFHGSDQPRPRIGAVCNIGHQRFAFSVLVGRDMAGVMGGQGITFFECDGAPRVTSP